MKSDFTFKNAELNRQFEKLTADEVKKMAKGFLAEYGSPLPFFSKNVDLHPTVVCGWLNGKQVLGKRSLKRIFAYLADAYPKYQDYIKL